MEMEKTKGARSEERGAEPVAPRKLPGSTDEDAAASSPRGTHTTDSRPSMTLLLGSDIPLVHARTHLQ
jgi:hypothetical protein